MLPKFLKLGLFFFYFFIFSSVQKCHAAFRRTYFTICVHSYFYAGGIYLFRQKLVPCSVTENHWEAVVIE